MNFLRKHFLGVIIFLLVAIYFGLYLLLVKPVLARRQELIKDTEENIVRLREYQDDPPSPEVIDRLNQDKKELENQYEEVMKTLNFARRRVLLPEETKDPLFLDEQISKFEEQIERAERELVRLGEERGMAIPERLGLGRERPESKEELSLLLSQLVVVRELVPLVIKSGVSHLFLLNPLSFSLEGTVPLPRERARPKAGDLPPGMEMPPGMGMPPGMEMPPGMGMPPGMEPRPRRETPSVVRDEFAQVLGFEELKFELGVRAGTSALTNLLYQLANHPYFFTVQDIEIRSVVGERREALSERREPARRDGRRMPVSPPGMEVSIDEEPSEELPIEKTELEVRLIIATRLFPSK